MSQNSSPFSVRRSSVFYKTNPSCVPWSRVLCLSIGIPQLVRHTYLVHPRA
jgi:hypothetical protein